MSKVTLDVKGIVLAPGELSKAPGALTTALNVNVEAPGIIRSRQGFAKQANAIGGPGWKLVSTKEMAANFLHNYGTNTEAGSLRYGDGSAAWTSITGTVTNQPATRMQCAVSRRNHYLTSDSGVQRLETTMALFQSGMPKGLALDLTGPTAILSGSPGLVLADTESVAYRVTWCKKDGEGVVMEGAPSSRTVIYNNTRTTGWVTATAKNVTCRILLPKQANTASTALTTSYFYRLYRSASVALGVIPSDEMQLVAEAFLASGDITAGYVDVTDSTPEAFRTLGDALYTNTGTGGDVGPEGLQGIDLSNNPPPRARDVVLYAGCLFYSDITYPCFSEFTILSTVASTGVTAGDTMTIDGIVYTAIAPGTPTNNQFVVATVAAGSSASEAIERTAQNFVECVNKSTTNVSVWAFYVSDPEKLPGRIRLESRTNGTTFSYTVSAHGTAYRPVLTAGVTSASDVHANGYAFSKPNLGDAVPAIFQDEIGRDDTAILRMVVHQDAVYMFTDAGLYRLTGRSVDDFAAQEFDLTFRLRGREQLCVCDDAIYAWGWEGIAKISSGGVEYISNAIEPLLQKAVKDVGDSWLATYSWAAAFRSRHKVLFAIPDRTNGSATNGNCPTILVYDTRMEAWTTWAFTQGGDGPKTTGHSCGAVRVSDDLLFLGQWNSTSADSSVYKERLTYAAADYIDDTYDASSVAITKTVRWNVVATSPELETHWDELHLLYDVSPTFTAWTTPSTLVAYFVADRDSTSGNVTLTPTSVSRMSRCSIPRSQRRSARLSVVVQHSTASEYFALEGMVVVHLPGEGTATVRQ